jgi:hypothetical protein
MTELAATHPEAAPSSELTCPSGCCEEGAILLGVVGADGVVGYISPRATVNAQFLQRVQVGGSPERRFRFAQPCVDSQCRQWTEAGCGVIDRVLAARDEADHLPGRSSSLPQCSIRRSCRWFAQRGARACEVCPFVVTDSCGTGEEAWGRGERSSSSAPRH